MQPIHAAMRMAAWCQMSSAAVLPGTAGFLSSVRLLSTQHSSTSESESGTIDFGFKQVPRQQKEALVGQVFSNVAHSYDVMNDLMSGGLHRLWKDRCAAANAWAARLHNSSFRPPGMQHLDVAGGTGDVAFKVLRAIQTAEQLEQLDQQRQWPVQQQQQQQQPCSPPGQVQPHSSWSSPSSLPRAQEEQQRGQVTVFDINPDMLQVGRSRAAAQGLVTGLTWVEGNAQELPFPDNCMDSYTVAFGIRNMTDRHAALCEAHRVLRRGGRLLCLEFSHVSLPLLKQVYDLYSFNVIPKIGGLVAQDEDSYQYLVESIRQFPDQESWADQIRHAGFKAVTYENLTGGVVAIHSGFKL